jgi:hypothetical protein
VAGKDLLQRRIAEVIKEESPQRLQAVAVTSSSIRSKARQMLLLKEIKKLAD